MQRKGHLYRDCQRLVNQDRNVFAALMVAAGDADAMVTGLTRSYHAAFEEVTRVIDPNPGERLFGMTLLLTRGRAVFIADTAVHETPDAQALADIACQAAAEVRRMGHEPRVAMLSYSNFGNPWSDKAERVREAIAILDRRKVDFEYDGEMAADVALEPELRKLYPFLRLTGPANVLVMPGLYAASISSKLLTKLGGGTAIGPMLMGLSKAVQITSPDATVSDIVNMAVVACCESMK
jgi:malate dehydrogenase (oxaloacetate-decarboxylating)(NADP+)